VQSPPHTLCKDLALIAIDDLNGVGEKGVAALCKMRGGGRREVRLAGGDLKLILRSELCCEVSCEDS
jgi:hypothetical protein